jgi:hypothetical protein
VPLVISPDAGYGAAATLSIAAVGALHAQKTRSAIAADASRSPDLRRPRPHDRFVCSGRPCDAIELATKQQRPNDSVA